MSKTNKNNATELRAKADAALAALAPFAAASAAARAEIDGKDGLACLVAQIRYYEIDGEAVAPRLAASLALDAAECAEGDDLALAGSPAELLSAGETSLAREREIEEELRRLRESRPALIENARSASVALRERRWEAGLPLPVAIPVLPSPDLGDGPLQRFSKYVRALSALVKNGPAADSHAEVIRDLRRQERDMRAQIERAHRAEEERARIRAEAEQERQRRKDEQARREQASRDAWAAKVRAEQEKTDELVAAQREREANNETLPTAAKEPTNAGWRTL